MNIYGASYVCMNMYITCNIYICMIFYVASNICMKMNGASDMYMNIYWASNVSMNVHGASNTCMKVFGALIGSYSFAFRIYGIHHLISWFSTRAWRKKLRIRQTSTVSYHEVLGMGLDEQVMSQNRVVMYSLCPWTLVGRFPCAQQMSFPWALVGPFPTERNEACSVRSDRVRDCKLHTTQTNSWT